MVSINILMSKANNGDVESCLDLMRQYAQGSKEVFGDPSSARKWGNLALTHLQQRGTVSQISDQDFKRLKEDADNNQVESCVQLSIIYATGTKTMFTDMSLARKWMDKAVDLYSHPQLISEKSKDSVKEENVAIDYATLSVEQLKELAQKDDLKACMELAQRYGQGVRGVFKDDLEAKKWEKKVRKQQSKQANRLTKDKDHIKDNGAIKIEEDYANLEDEDMNSKDAVVKRYRQFLHELKTCYDRLDSLQCSDKDFANVINKMKNQLQGEIMSVHQTAKEVMNATVWDHLVIAFFGETGAGKSTIIETFRILFNEKTRLEALSKKQNGVDGEIVGHGESDFTKVYSEYDMSIKSQPFTLIDVPGIEGDEAVFKDEIKKALGKAHIVFYVQGHNKQPDTKTVEKIKNYLQDWVNVYSIYNVRGGSGNYNETEERKTLFTRNVTQMTDLIGQTFRDTLGRQYKGNVSLQGLLALCSVAKFSDKRDDLKRTQTKLERYFGSKDAVFDFSGFKAIEDLVFEKSDNYADEIVEANKQKLIRMGKDAYKHIKEVLDNNDEALQKYKGLLSDFRRYVNDRYGRTISLINQKASGEMDSMFSRIRTDIYEAIDDENVEESHIRDLINSEISTFSNMVSDGVRLETKNLRNGIEKKKKSLDVMLAGGSIDSSIRIDISNSLNLDDAFSEMDISFGDVFGFGASVASGAAIGSAFTFIAPGVATVVGGIIGGATHLLRKAWFGDGGKGKAKEKVRQQLSGAKSRAKRELQDKMEQKIERPLNRSKETIIKNVRGKEQVFNTAILSIKDCQDALKHFVVFLNKKDYGNI